MSVSGRMIPIPRTFSEAVLIEYPYIISCEIRGSVDFTFYINYLYPALPMRSYAKNS